LSSVVAAKELVKTAFAAAVAGSGPDVGPFVERDQRPVMVSLASRGVDEGQIGRAFGSVAAASRKGVSSP
jgi:hypothetical protein